MADLPFTLFEAAPTAVEAAHVCGPIQETDHAGTALARLLEQFKAQPRLAALLGAYTTQIQELEDVLWDLRSLRQVETATDAQLDGIGRIVGQARGGLDDDNYRAVIRARIQANRSDGQPDQLLKITRLALSATTDLMVLSLVEDYPAALRLQNAADISPIDPEVVNDLLQDAKSAGVRLQFLFQLQPDAETFTYAPGATLVTGDAGQGYGDVAMTTGGFYAGVLD